MNQEIIIQNPWWNTGKVPEKRIGEPARGRD